MPDSSPDFARVEAWTRRINAYAHTVHDFEIVGLNNLPRTGGALMVFYHSFAAIDVWMFGSAVYQQTNRLIRFLADRFLFYTPVLKDVVQWGGAVPGNRPDAIRMLQEGHLVGVAPGGVREAIVPRHLHYQVVWGERMGFAHVATQAHVDIIPIFIENSEELLRAPGVQLPPFPQLYEMTRFPIVPIVGLGALPFPVRLTAHVGAPIVFDPARTPEQLRDLTRDRMQSLIDDNQDRRRPRLLRAMLDRTRRRR
ncbi:MAG: lysophospholipid acyltransferase family protein [Myxococcota bacterium]